MTVLTVNSIPVGIFSDVCSTQTAKAFFACMKWVYGTCINVILCANFHEACTAEQHYVQISYTEFHSYETV